MSADEIIANEPVKITLAGGQKMTVRYGMPSFRAIEKEYDSIGNFAELVDLREKGPTFTLITFGLWVGTPMKMPLAEFEAKLELERFTEYGEAFGLVFSRALKALSPGEAKAVEETA